MTATTETAAAPVVGTEQIRAINGTAAFNRWAGFEVESAEGGEAVLALRWREEFGQYAGFLHAGMVGAMIDTACGYAAATVAGRVLAANCQVSFFAPAVGDRFLARARVVKAGRRQIFTAAELFAAKDGEERLVAGGSTILMTAQWPKGDIRQG
jgi:uncharacterized protein (TIGR00369 family)